ncbi:type II toxin-antitoxin system MqsA family antitoxin [Stenotrophomonas muris]|uniref:type II toxin-antitoxin system MqsA family antitoxin n=1 Tax=Stenotrophomonas muris TaxID=2963283 RepID=UPI0018D38729|nr:type II toxin-antitoxin system MqsA family antitoxin [Stenotrophomonas maltophilia]
MNDICPICEVGSLVPGTGSQTISYNGKSLVVHGLGFAKCECCGEELVFPEVAKANDKIYADAKRGADGLWTSDRILEWRTRWRISQQQAAKILGGGVNAFSKYERGEVVQSKSMDLLMRVFNESAEARNFLLAQAGELDALGWKRQEDIVVPNVKAAAVRIDNIMDYVSGLHGLQQHAAANWEAQDVMYAEAV